MLKLNKEYIFIQRKLWVNRKLLCEYFDERELKNLCLNVCGYVKWAQVNCVLKMHKSSKPTWLGLTDYIVFLLRGKKIFMSHSPIIQFCFLIMETTHFLASSSRWYISEGWYKICHHLWLILFNVNKLLCS